MKTAAIVLPTVWAALASGGILRAQAHEFSIFGGYQRMSTAGLGTQSDSDAATDDDVHFRRGAYATGARLTFNTRGYYGHEIFYMIGRPTLVNTIYNDDGTISQEAEKIKEQVAGYNFLIYFMPRDERWRPFITGGLQYYRFSDPNFADWVATFHRTYGGNFGGGIKLRPSSRVVFRLDFRDYIGGKPYGLNSPTSAVAQGSIHQLEGTVGLAVTF